MVKDIRSAYILTLLEKHPDPQMIAALGVEGVLAECKERGTARRVDTIRAIVAVAAQNCASCNEKPLLLRETALLARRIKHLRSELREVEDMVRQVVSGDPEVAKLASMGGLKDVTVAGVVSEIQDIGNFSTEPKLASYAGLGLRREQTGKSKNTWLPQMRANRYLKRHFLAMAMGRIHHDPRTKAYYRKKTTEGKSHLQALRATARQICRLVYGELRRARR